MSPRHTNNGIHKHRCTNTAVCNINVAVQPTVLVEILAKLCQNFAKEYMNTGIHDSCPVGWVN